MCVRITKKRGSYYEEKEFVSRKKVVRITKKKSSDYEKKWFVLRTCFRDVFVMMFVITNVFRGHITNTMFVITNIITNRHENHHEHVTNRHEYDVCFLAFFFVMCS